MSAVGNTLNGGNPPLHFEPKTLFFSLTAAKVERIAYITFATLSIFAAAALVLLPLLAPIILPTFVAIPLFTGAGLAIWQVTRIVDYNSPQQIEALREQAKNTSLKETFELHGGYMFSRGIPLPAAFGPLYNQALTSKPFHEAIILHLRYHKAWNQNKNNELKFPYVDTKKAPDFLDNSWVNCKTIALDALLYCDLELLQEVDYITNNQKDKLAPLFKQISSATDSDKPDLLDQIKTILQ